MTETTSIKGVSKQQTLSLDFHLSARRQGTVSITVEPDSNPLDYGKDLLLPTLLPDTPLETALKRTLDFPVITAKVHSTGARGYGAYYGWIQLTRSAEPSLTAAHAWEMDPIPITAELNTPFVWFGPEPTLFDGPFRPRDTDVEWSAHSFLAEVGDSCLSRDVRPILGFEWGFWIREGRVLVKEVRRLDLEAWDGHLALFRGKFEGWRFRGTEGR